MATLSQLLVRRLAWTAAFLLFLASLTGCRTLPLAQAFAPSFALRADANSVIGKHVTQSLNGRPADHSGLHLLADAQEAFEARMVLIGNAQRSIDLQYYIFRSDSAGGAMIDALVQAAQRGIRVRLLLDGWGARPSDEHLRELAAVPNFEVRVFNPLINSRWPMLSMLLNFNQAHRRMHNKLLVVDGLAAIAGGRNVGDEYFQHRREFAFADVDALAIGPVVADLAAGFDTYWNAVIAAVVLPRDGAPHTASANAQMPAPVSPSISSRYSECLHSDCLRYFTGQAAAVYDLPEKVNPSRPGTATSLGSEISKVMGVVRSELLIVSPYFVPGDGGVKQLVAMANSGVRITIVTNSLAATDVPAVHAGYARHRKVLLRAGIALYELRADALGRSQRQARSGSSRVSLHAKVIVADRSQSFIGSMNVDPRSLRLNTENGIVFNNRSMAQELVQGVERDLPNDAWRLHLEGDSLRWSGMRGQEPQSFNSEPFASFLLQLRTRFLAFLPIEDLL